MRRPGGRHLLINPSELAPAVGFTHAVVSTGGRTVYLAGQVAADGRGHIVGTTFAEQFDVALGNVLIAVAGAGGAPGDVVSMVMYTTTMAEYRESVADLGGIWRRHFGRHYPAMAALGVTELVDPSAKLELVATAVITA